MADMKKLIESLDKIAKEGTMSSAAKHKEGPKFGGYWKGTDSKPPGEGMGVGGADESDEHFTYEEDKAYLGEPHIREENNSLAPPGYALRVTELEDEGLTRSDAQGVADMEYRLKIGPWKKDKEVVDAVGKEIDENDDEEYNYDQNGVLGALDHGQNKAQSRERQKEECPACDGSGIESYVAGQGSVACSYCNGTGYLHNEDEVDENYLSRMQGGASGIVEEDPWSLPDGGQWTSTADGGLWGHGNMWSSKPDQWTSESIEEGEEYKNNYEDESDSELYSGCFVRDIQTDGPNGEIFKMSGDPYERRVRISDKDGRGWYISPSRLTKVDDNDLEIREYFPKEGRDEDFGPHGPNCDCEICNDRQDESLEEAKPTTIISRLKQAIKDGTINADQISRDKEGNFIFRQEYYYHHGKDSKKFADIIKSSLERLEFKVNIIDHGDHWAPFRGGASTKDSSHFWVKAHIIDTLPDTAIKSTSVKEEGEPLFNEAEFTDLARNKAFAGAKVENRADPEKMAIWWSHYRRAKVRGQNDRQAKMYADRMTKTEPKFQDNPFIAKESMGPGDYLNINWGRCKVEDGGWYVRKLFRNPLCVAGPFDTMLDANINRLSQDFKDDYDVAQYSAAAHNFIKPVKEESLEEIQEGLKTAFEDYVKNKAEPDDKKERVTITYKDGHTQTKLVTQKEKQSYETSSTVKSVTPAQKGSRDRIDDEKLDENKNPVFRWTDYEYITNVEDRLTLIEAIITESNHLFESNTEDTNKYFLNLESLSDTPEPNKKYITAVLGLANDKIIPLQPIEVTEFLSFNGDFCTVKLTNGKITEFPFNAIRNKIFIKTFFFDSKYKFDKFQLAITLKFGAVQLIQSGSEEFGTGLNESDDEWQQILDHWKQTHGGKAPEGKEQESFARISWERKKRKEKNSKRSKDTEKKLTEGASTEEIASAIAWRISNQKPELITKYGVEFLADAIDEVASFHAGAKELGSSDISIMVNQVMKNLERSYAKEDKGTLFTEAKFASKARNILLNKLKDMERMNKPVVPNKPIEKEPEKEPEKKNPLEEEIQETVAPYALQLFDYMRPETRNKAFEYLDMLRDKIGPELTLQTYRMAQKMRKANKEFVKNSPKDAPVDEDAAIDPTTGQPVATTTQNNTAGQQPAVKTATPVTTPQTTAQQPPAPRGSITAIPAPGQPAPAKPGQPGGAPVAQPPGTPKPPSGTAVNTATTPIQNLATSLQQLAQPGSQLAAKKAADALSRIR